MDLVPVLQIVVVSQKSTPVVTLVADHILRGLCLDILSVELPELPPCGVVVLWTKTR